ncbi:BamA/TamA family outer membrane protein [Microcoleus sp. FACHB-1515]|uniref:BamA/TamA family outer membrane protein n=1 Tax=Cyanophyceae TaxID=3028117 RepID=UPI001682DD2C|nr:BamA/TamA family outer membrane protein [Microcoleus sp. FACHB-1515]MBD2091721.1 BamA/TamA family outer membrane protein [Microcoleus sp. FACHB-1515]
MRFSPILLAVLSASATVGLSSPTRAAEAISASAPEVGIAATGTIATGTTATVPSALRDRPAAVLPAAPEVAQAPTESAPSPASQEAAPDADDSGENLPGNPPPGTQTPSQSDTDRIQIELDDPPTIEITPTPDASPTPAAPPVTPTPAPTPTPTPTPSAEQEPRVLVAEVVVSGATGELEDEVYQVIETRPGRTTTRSQLQADINAVFATGFFSNVRAVPTDTPLGVRVTFEVQPNPVLQQVQIQGTQVLPPAVIDEIFQPQYGRILNLNDFQAGIEDLNEWYRSNGYVLAQVIGAPQVSSEGVVTLQVAEGVIEDIQVRFLDDEGNATDEEGNPIEGNTREFIITREFESQSGDVFNQQQIQADLQRVFGLGIFDDVRVSLNPGQDPRQVDVTVNVIERNTGNIAAAAGFSSASGLFGSLSYTEQNLGGNNQRLSAEVQAGTQGDLLFNLGFTDPWIAGDPYRTSYSINAFRRQSISLIFDGGPDEVELENGDRPRVNRLGGGISFSRPLEEWLGLEGWRASLGLQYQHVTITDGDGDRVTEDEEGNPLSFSGEGVDDITTLQLSAVSDQRGFTDNQATSGSLFRLSTEQSIPIGSGNILFNRLRGSYSQYIPVNFTNFTDGPETLFFNLQAGTVLGDLPPYEAFSLGGTDSIRGYGSGDLGSGRSFVQGTVEYRFPIFAIVGGALFVDAGTDLGSGDTVLGDPAGARDKPGSGFGVGAGIRVNSPLGQIRVDFAVNDDGDNRIHFGIGERF